MSGSLKRDACGFAAVRGRRLLACAAAMAALAAPAGPAGAASSDLATCDRLAAHPGDPDRPAGVPGSLDIAEQDVATALKACRAASGQAGAPRRAWFELGRA